MIKTVLFQTIQLSISTQLSSIWSIHRTLSSATTPDQSGPWSNEEARHIPQSSSFTGTSSSDCLVSYLGHLLGGGVLPLFRGTVSVFYSPSQLGKLNYGWSWLYIYIYTHTQRKVESKVSPRFSPMILGNLNHYIISLTWYNLLSSHC